MGQIATCFYRLCFKEIVKQDVNTDYDTYGHEEDVDYVTDRNHYYEHDYDDMESAETDDQRMRVRILS